LGDLISGSLDVYLPDSSFATDVRKNDVLSGSSIVFLDVLGAFLYFFLRPNPALLIDVLLG
jgi:hypothetical protein